MRIAKEKIEAVNMAHAFANEVTPLLLASLADCVGQKITKADGSLRHPHDKRLAGIVGDVLRNHPKNVLAHFEAGKYSLRLSICAHTQTVDERTPYFNTIANYFHATVYLGNIKSDGKFEFMERPFEPLPVFTEEEISERLERLKKAEAELEEAKSALHPFITH